MRYFLSVEGLKDITISNKHLFLALYSMLNPDPNDVSKIEPLLDDANVLFLEPYTSVETICTHYYPVSNNGFSYASENMPLIIVEMQMHGFCTVITGLDKQGETLRVNFVGIPDRQLKAKHRRKTLDDIIPTL